MRKSTLQNLLFACVAIMLPVSMQADIYSISGGTDITLNFDTETNTLTVNGTGEMSNWTSSNAPGPNRFPEEYKKIKKIVIEEGITSIGAWSFYNLHNVTSVRIANSVTKIGSGAFYNCGTSNLEVALPSSLETIESDAGVPAGAIPASLTTIRPSGLRLRTISTLTVDEENPVYYSEGNCIIERATKKVICGCKTAIIPDDVKIIGEEAFESTYFTTTSINLPKSVTSIESKAFYYSNITSITLPNTLKTIDFMAFGGTDLQTIISLSETPPSINDICNSVGITLMVPNPEVYATTVWIDEVSQIVGLPFENISDGSRAEYRNSEERELESITYTRTLPNMTWNALYVPFEIPMSQLADNYDVAYINDIRSYDRDENGVIDDMTMEIIRINSGTLNANYPYLIRAKSEKAKNMELTLTDATLYKTEENAITCSSVFMDFKVTGTYTALSAEELEGMYAISTTGEWQQLNPGTTLKPFRLYMEMTARGGMPVKMESAVLSRIRICVQGEEDKATGMDFVGTPQNTYDDTLYDLNGRKVTVPVKGGIYIRNGKKVYVK